MKGLGSLQDEHSISKGSDDDLVAGLEVEGLAGFARDDDLVLGG